MRELHPPAWLMRPDWICLQRTRDENKLPVGDTDDPEGQSLRTPGLEASGRGASQRQQWWTPAGSNRRPLRCKRSALPLS